MGRQSISSPVVAVPQDSPNLGPRLSAPCGLRGIPRAESVVGILESVNRNPELARAIALQTAASMPEMSSFPRPGEVRRERTPTPSFSPQRESRALYLERLGRDTQDASPLSQGDQSSVDHAGIVPRIWMWERARDSRCGENDGGGLPRPRMKDESSLLSWQLPWPCRGHA